jgi:hypothetical protein
MSNALKTQIAELETKIANLYADVEINVYGSPAEEDELLALLLELGE